VARDFGLAQVKGSGEFTYAQLTLSHDEQRDFAACVICQAFEHRSGSHGPHHGCLELFGLARNVAPYALLNVMSRKH
jgi:hypothetical protein